MEEKKDDEPPAQLGAMGKPVVASFAVVIIATLCIHCVLCIFNILFSFS